MNPYWTGIHEAGHAVAYLSQGVRVEEVWLDGVGNGHVRTKGYVDPSVRLFAVNAGYLAERHFGNRHAIPSDGDIEMIESCCRKLHLCGRALNQTVAKHEAIIGTFSEEIAELAEALRIPRQLGTIGFARLMSNSSSLLYQYSDLYAADIAALPAIDAQLRLEQQKRASVERDRQLQAQRPQRMYAKCAGGLL